MDQAFAAAKAEWKPDAPGFLAIHHDIATYANGLFDYRRAETSARTAVTLAIARTGPNGAEQALVSQNLAVALAGMGQRNEAAAIFARIVPQLDAGADRAAAANAEIAYSDFEYTAGRPAAGLDHARRAATIARGADIPAGLKASALLRLADASRRALQFAEANAAADEAAAALKAAGGDTPPRLTLVRAAIAYEQGRLTRALDLVQQAEKAAIRPDPCDPTLATDVAQRRGTIHMIRRELPEASASFTTALAALAALKLGNNPREGEIVYGLAVVAGMSRDFDRSASLFDGVVGLARKAYGDGSEAEAQALMEKALMLGEAQRAKEGVAAAKAALAILERPVEQAPLTLAYAHASLGLVSRKAGDLPAAERELGLALTAFRDARGAKSFDLTPGLSALGEIALERRDAPRAETYFRRALAIQRRWGGDSALALGVTLSNLASARAAQGATGDALDRSQEAVDVLRKRLAIGEARPWNDAQAERRAARNILTRDLALTTAGVKPGEPVRGDAAVRRMLATNQLANAASTGGAIAQMATRLQAADPALGALLGERNDLSAEWRYIQDELVGSLAAGVEDDDARRDALLTRQQAVASRVAEIDAQLVVRNPRLDLLIKSRVVDLPDLQRTLRDGEAALAFTVADDATYVIAVRRDAAIAYRAALGRQEMTRLVESLRATLDPSRWKTELPTYDAAGAYRLFAALIAPANDFLQASDTLLVVPDGPLASLPFAVLVTEAPPAINGDAADYTKLAWLIRRAAIVNYPSIASIVALRAVEGGMAPRRTMLGVGGALFAGAANDNAQRGAILRGMARTRLADVGLLRQLTPLPETSDELGKIADSIGRSGAKLLLGRDASEAVIRSTPLEGFGVVVFATHGLVAGELSGYAEPALALTPPPVASSADDGLLSASEIALLRMRADWVILSACNTAADDGSPNAEPLSGLAKSFFYAGARSLLVTHWPVESDAAAIITSATVRRTAEGDTPAKALRKTAIDFIEDRDGSLKTHPFFWAPFSLTGG
ncbi:hypothetical protein ACFB49_30250 [Sphingomonas sp. DBB INV C78]|uniref:CHAT domain-containing protein n=1 Tax=Sphingomonas sp. DBB INV C78 TaxID=3349434 RepID=UPI0036D3DB67